MGAGRNDPRAIQTWLHRKGRTRSDPAVVSSLTIQPGGSSPAVHQQWPAGAARPGERRLVDGRFTDEVITGAPVTGTKNRRSFTLVPTSAAVMWWGATGHVADMHAPPFQGKLDVPRLLQWTPGGSPAYVADGTLYSLENDEKPSGSWTVRLPPKAVFEHLPSSDQSMESSGPGPLPAAITPS
jgi:hypothetical protein